MPLADSLLPYLQRTHGINITGCCVELKMHLKKNTLNKISLYGFKFTFFVVDVDHISVKKS